ncbi:8768_t:CDS:1, partial [Cetraspora pellucida]
KKINNQDQQRSLLELGRYMPDPTDLTNSTQAILATDFSFYYVSDMAQIR